MKRLQSEGFGKVTVLKSNRQVGKGMARLRFNGWRGVLLLMIIAFLLPACYSKSTTEPLPPPVERPKGENSSGPQSAQEKNGEVLNDGGPNQSSPANGDGGSASGGSSEQPAPPTGEGSAGTPLTNLSPIRFSYVSSDAIFPNPERGFYGGSNLLTDRWRRSDFGDHMDNGWTLTNSTILLDRYRNSDLPESLLNNLRAGLESLRGSQGVKAILRFSYNKGFNEPDASKEIILRHISQLKPVFQEYYDVIAFLQAGFIGSWGEWHHSTNGLTNPSDMREILQALADALPASRMLQIRYPFRKWEIFNGEEVTAQTAFTTRLVARVGHHNDCFLAVATADEGYLPNNDASNAEIQVMREYIRREALYTPVGGETCEMGRKDDGLRDMAYLRWTYLNAYYYRPLLDYWRQIGFYPIIQRKLGYRFVLEEGQITSGVTAGDSVDAQLTLSNEGWANLYNPRPVYLVIENATERREFRLEGENSDPRWWQPGKRVEIRSTLPLPADLAGGEYTVALWLPDESSSLQRNPWFSIRFANEGVWDPAKGYNVLGKIYIHPR